jgi:rubrerythrin
VDDALGLDERALAEIPRGSALDAFLEALHVAIRLEEEGIQFFTLNAHRVRNPRGRAAFHVLLRDQRILLGKLKAQLDGVQQALRGTPDEERAGGAPERELTPNPVFSRGRELAERDVDEREVVRQGIAIEWETYGFYLERGQTATDPWAKLIYDDLALEERRRYESLVGVYECLVGARPAGA